MSLGKAVASLVMILGYSIIAVPTGIVSVEIARASRHAPRLATDSRDAPDGTGATVAGPLGDARFA